jgi:hypothetical protein
MNGRSRFLVLGAAFVFGFVLFPVPAAGAQASDGELIARVSDYVERYFARAQTIVATETVIVQPVTRSLETAGTPRRVVNDVRIEWDGRGAQPRAVREMVTAGGSRFGPGGQPDCLDPRSFTLEPLAFLLPSNRDTVRLSVGRTDTIGGIRAQRIEYQPRSVEPPQVRWDGKCGWIDTFGRTRGRVWVNPATGAVLRLEERLDGHVRLPGPQGDPNAPEFVAERADTTIDYLMVAFTDPDELLLLPSRVESVTFIRNSALPRMRVTRTFTDYRRFLTAGRVLP